MEIELIAIVLILIILPLLVWLIKKWYDSYQLKKGAVIISDSATSTAYLPPPAIPGKKRIVSTAKQLADWAFDIKDSIHLFSSDDMATILATIKQVKTKLELSMLFDNLSELGINILDVVNKGLDSGQRDIFAKWMKDVPVYV